MKDETKKLYKNTAIIFVSKFCTQFLSFFLLPVLTAALTTDEYGTYDLLLTYAFLLLPIMTLRVDYGMFRFLIDDRKEKKDVSKIVTNGIIIILKNLIFFSVIYMIIYIFWRSDTLIYVYFYALFYVISNVLLQISRGLGDNITYSIASIITGTSNLILSLISVLILGAGIEGLILSGILSYLFGAIYVFIKKKIYKYILLKEKSKEENKKLLKYSLPLIPNSLSSWILNISDKTMLSMFLGTGISGIYSVSTKFSTLISRVYSVFDLSWTESASVMSNSEERDKFFSQSIIGIFNISLCICLVMICAMPIAFRIMVNSSFNEAYKYIPLLVIGVIFEILSNLLGTVYISLKKTKSIAITTFIAGIVNILINVLFIPKIGIYAACISTIVSYLILFIYRYIDLRKYVKIRMINKNILAIAIFFMLSIILYYLNSVLISVITTTIAMLVCVYTNKDIINIFIKRKSKFSK